MLMNKTTKCTLRIQYTTILVYFRDVCSLHLISTSYCSTASKSKNLCLEPNTYLIDPPLLLGKLASVLSIVPSGSIPSFPRPQTLELGLAQIFCFTACLTLALAANNLIIFHSHNLTPLKEEEARVDSRFSTTPCTLFPTLHLRKGLFLPFRDGFRTGRKTAGTVFQLLAPLCLRVTSDQCMRQSWLWRPELGC